MAKRRKKKQKNNNKKLSHSLDSTLLEKKIKLLETSQKGKTLIKVVVAIPPLFYGFLKLQDIDIIAFTNDDNSKIILQISFFLYYISWVYGTIFDMKTYDVSLISSQKEKGITFVDYLVALSIALMFTLLLYSPKLIYVAIFLFLFWLIDLISYNYFIKYKINPLLQESKKEYEKIESSWALLRLNTTEKYITGKWKLIRYYIGFIILFLLILFSFENSISTFFNSLIGIRSNDFISAFIFLLFVVSMEGWIWFYRIKTKITMSIISRHEELYSLVKK